MACIDRFAKVSLIETARSSTTICLGAKDRFDTQHGEVVSISGCAGLIRLDSSRRRVADYPR